jgi:hypothetical protein
LRLDGENISAIAVKDTRIYVPHGNQSRQSLSGISGCLVDMQTLGPKGWFMIPKNELKVLNAGADGIVYGLKTRAETETIDPRSVQLVER